APVPVGGPLSVRDDSGGTRLRGSIKHSLPTPLTDVTIVVVRGQKPLRGDLVSNTAAVAPLFGRVSAARLTSDLAPGDVINLEEIRPSDWDTGERYFERLVEVLSRNLGAFPAATTPDRRDAATRLEAISWHSALRPPDFRSTSGTAQRL